MKQIWFEGSLSLEAFSNVLNLVHSSEVDWRRSTQLTQGSSTLPLDCPSSLS